MIAAASSDPAFQPDMTNRELFDALRTYIDTRLADFATKEYLDERLKSFATKDDLQAFATKDDLKQMEIRLTRKLDSHKQVYIQQHLTVRADIGDLHNEVTKVNERIDRLGTSLPEAAAA